MTRKKVGPALARLNKYARAVIKGKIVAGPHVRNACRRHLSDVKIGSQRGIYFNEPEAARALGFFPDRLKLSEGQFDGIPFVLHDAQAFIIGSIYGWYKTNTKTRRFRRAYIEQGKGNGKSPLAGGIGLYGLMADREPGAQIYSAASKKEQANILFRDAVNMAKKAPEIARRLTPSGGPGNEYNLAYLRNGSFFRPISRNAGKSGSGPRPHYALVDELHELEDRKIIEMLERGFKSRRQPLLFMITNSGSDRNSICWEEHEHAIKVAAGNKTATDDDAHYIGDVIDDTTFSYVCALDKGDDPLTDPTCWAKANPLLGTILTEEYLAGVVAQARDMPGKLNGILRLHFCQWTDSVSAWIPRALLEPCLADFDPIEEHRDETVYIGLDLSQNKDLTAKASVVKTGTVARGKHKGKPTYDAWLEIWTPGDTVAARAIEDKTDYELWVREGHISAPAGKSISYTHVAQAIAEDAHTFDIGLLAYDAYAFRRGLVPEIDKTGIDINDAYIEHPQGGVKKGKPNEAMIEAAEEADREPEGLWMPGSVRQLEDLLLEKRIRIQSNPATISAMMSAATDADRWENRWLAKGLSTNRIDAAVALCMAVGAAVAMENIETVDLDEWLDGFKE